MFQCHARIRVMHPLNVIELLQIISRQFYVNSLQRSFRTQEDDTLRTQVLHCMGMMEEDDLADVFKKYLDEKRYLIVLDDLCTIEDWDRIKSCFPNNNTGSRIMLSTEQVEVASLSIGANNTAVDHKQLSSDRNVYAFYKKDSEDGTYSMETESGSNAATAGNNISDDRKILHERTIHLIGREREQSDIINLITNENQHLEVISVWGMGGIGKTTLVRAVYENQELMDQFEKRACVTAMHPFNCDELLRSLALQFGYEDAIDLTRKLEKKKFLIVVDDIASTAEWDSIVPYFPATDTASRIILTTRTESIAKHCSEKHENIYQLRSLGYRDAHDLFTETVFGLIIEMDEQYPELIESTNLILMKCNGLPLAIISIGCLLAARPKTSEEWTKLNEHLNAELSMDPTHGRIIQVLIRSYDGLPYHLKCCFLYLSIFPEGYIIRRRWLVRRWIAEGYIKEVRGKSAEEIAENYFTELVSRSMIIAFNISDFTRKGADSCQVHDLIRGVGTTKLMEEDLVFRLEEGCNLNNHCTVRHLAIDSNWERDQREFKRIMDLSRVRSITVFGKWRPYFISENMKLLRVLDLAGTTGLLNHHLEHIGNFLHMNYLSLRGCGDIFRLPHSLGNLRQLQTLDVRGTSLVMLPKAITKLRKLQYLLAGSKSTDVDEGWRSSTSKRRARLDMGPVCCAACCVPHLVGIDGFNRRDACTLACCVAFPSVIMGLHAGGVTVPRGVSKLEALDTLGIVNLTREEAVIHEIKRLTGLRKLGVVGINKKNGSNVCSAISNLSHLESLSLQSDDDTGLSGCIGAISSLPKRLESLKLYGNLIKLPEWIPELWNLVKLKLQGSRILEHRAALSLLGNIPNLAMLCLWKQSFDGEEIRFHFHRNAFPSLKVLGMDHLGDLESVEFEEGAAPKLELLRYSGLQSETNSRLFSGLLYLRSLEKVQLDGSYAFAEDLRAQLDININKPVLKVD
uniref:Uncharacterized protein n=1 Tax=Avena sativa TaxID=4498 RepID=A0ACD5V8X2_AVESA